MTPPTLKKTSSSAINKSHSFLYEYGSITKEKILKKLENNKNKNDEKTAVKNSDGRGSNKIVYSKSSP
jgi:hypothetical protein